MLAGVGQLRCGKGVLRFTQLCHLTTPVRSDQVRGRCVLSCGYAMATAVPRVAIAAALFVLRLGGGHFG